MSISPCAPSFIMPPVRLGVMTKRGLSLVINGSTASTKYTVINQNRDELLIPENSPSLSMWPYLVCSAQTRQLNQISIYAQRGASRDQSRLLYMNAAALNIWREMGRAVTVIGEAYRPPSSALLCFGMPFSE